MLRSYRTANGTIDWTTLGWGRIWPLTMGLLLGSVLILRVLDPSGARRTDIDSCLSGVSAGPVITIPCTGVLMDDSLRTFLERPENRHLEVVTIVAITNSSILNHDYGFKVVLRERSH